MTEAEAAELGALALKLGALALKLGAMAQRQCRRRHRVFRRLCGGLRAAKLDLTERVEK